MAKTPDFNKVVAFDELGKLMASTPKEPTFSDSVKMISSCQEFLQKLYDDAFQKGFEAGCDASEKTNNLSDDSK